MRAAAAVALLVIGFTAARPAAAQPARGPAGGTDAAVRAILAFESGHETSPEAALSLVRLVRDAAVPLPVRRAALRALGRVEQLDLLPVIQPFLNDPDLRDTAELGFLLTLRAHAGAKPDAVAPQVDALVALPASPRILGQLPYSTAAQPERAEGLLRARLADPKGPRAGAADGLEALIRRNRKIYKPSAETLDVLKRAVRRDLPGGSGKPDPAVVQSAAAALVAANAADADVVDAVLGDSSPHVRRLGALALVTASSIEPARRQASIRTALADASASVRYEAVRAWARQEAAGNGCAPLLAAIADTSLHVALAAIDAFGQSCAGDASISDRLVAIASGPLDRGWHRQAHALVALAERAPDRAGPLVATMAKRPVWQARMYAARAAAILKDTSVLTALAADAHDNVREAAIGPLRTIAGDDAIPAIVDSLGRRDYQLLRTAAIALKGAPRNEAVAFALAGALERVTAERRDTSRDTRLALLERLAEQGAVPHAQVLERLLTDDDPAVAESAAAVLSKATGREAKAAPAPRPRQPLPTDVERTEDLVARVVLDTGGTFDIVFDRETAPLAYARFARLIRARYYDGLTFHRVVPNFVIQGGSPGANEYEGDGPYMRDELGPGTHAPGTVGISTRGRHTGDAQIFVNLADNRRLDFDYTIVGTVSDLAAAEGVVEGTAIREIRLVPRAR